ncbi:MAG: 3-hydroxy-2-methylbutyryl-CoA dehydrogenase, partial [Ramlibacter sp.]|nr:3-hydroxy-2-methylbutyryl-CoA dehydrogenase [Ramlibacter sp.]
MKLDSSIAAVITGGASGLGAATARRLASHGVRVAIFDFNAETGEALARELGSTFCKVDVTSEEQVKTGFEMARAAQGQERILVNCAGTGNGIKTASRDKATGAPKHFPLPDFEKIIQINLIGTFRCIAHSAHGMADLEPLEDGEKGVIINTASVAAEDGQIGQAAYSASKGGVLAMTLPIARDLMNEGIRVNTILPGVFKTPMVAMMP